MATLLRICLLALLIILIPFDVGCHLSDNLVTAPVVPELQVVPPVTLEPTLRPRVVLITIDGTRWQEIFNGTDPILWNGEPKTAREIMPNMYKYFVDGGQVVGRDSLFIATGPNHISLPGYLEIMRGHPSTDCQSNECQHIKLNETIADLFEHPAVFASWDTIKLTVSDKIETDKRFVVRCGRNYRSPGWKSLKLADEKGFPEYFDPEYIPDYRIELLAEDYLKQYNPDFLWISFGDTDEWAHAGNYKEYLWALSDADYFIGKIIEKYSESLDDKETTFIVTADHGRKHVWQDHGMETESERNWLMMYGRGVSVQGFVRYEETKSLSNIKPTVEYLLTGKRNNRSLL